MSAARRGRYYGKTPAEQVRLMAGQVVELAAADGLVLTIDRRPLKPLAMGHAETVIEVRPARHPHQTATK